MSGDDSTSLHSHTLLPDMAIHGPPPPVDWFFILPVTLCGFATATVAVIATLFANDVDFQDAVPHIEFAKAMLKNHFLFSQNKGTDSKVVASSRRTNTMDITDIVSSSKEDKSQTPPSPTPRSLKKVATNAKSKGGKQSQKQDDQATTIEADKDSTPQCLGSGVNNKYIKDSLPPSCTMDNVWRRLYISALAHFAARYGNPWSISSEQFRSALQEIWDMVYGGDIEHTVTASGLVFHITCYTMDAVPRIEFAKAMLKKNHFLFSQNKGTDSKSRLWRSPLVLQTFAHHFNYIQG
ncbi:hypothetical protein BS17DRAFT_770428 [Gyrodon lividus]|nr:hypothetical protein BS17DRAFT_770428 [Gyrodon lividus]